MNKVIILMIMLVGFGLVTQDVYAKRFGGGRSFGSHRSFAHYSKKPQAQKVASKSNKNRLGGLLGGMLIGGFLASLFMGHGLFSTVFSWLFLAGILLILFQLFSRKMQLAKSRADKNQTRNW